jgi:hypothetical protein
MQSRVLLVAMTARYIGGLPTILLKIAHKPTSAGMSGGASLLFDVDVCPTLSLALFVG